ncbi:MAG: DUF3108 domain-containing protein [Flavicella sp.]
MKTFYYFLFTIFTTTAFAQAQSGAKSENAYQDSEFLKYRIHYGIINAGYATLKVHEVAKDSAFHFVGKGWTVGVSDWFFKVRDRYESYIDAKTQLPTHFIRDINEGGYKIKRDIYFDHSNNKVTIEDHKKDTIYKVDAFQVHDMISGFYSLRNHPIDTLKIGESISIDMFFDGETNPFKLVFLGEDILKTKFGKIPCYKLRPMVQSGRVFKAKESVTLWVSADNKRIPLRIKADLAVGSLKVDLTSYSGLTHSF